MAQFIEHRHHSITKGTKVKHSRIFFRLMRKLYTVQSFILPHSFLFQAEIWTVTYYHVLEVYYGEA